MAENYTGENQPVDGAGAKFRGVRTDTGGGASEFLSPAGDAPTTENGKRVAAQRVNQPSTVGMGYAIGTREDSSATSDTGTFSLLALIKRLLEHITTIVGWVAAIGTTGDSATEGDTNGSMIAKARGIAKTIGTQADAAIQATNVGTLSARLRGVQATLGTTGDLATGGLLDGTVKGHLRYVALWAQERMPAALGGASLDASLPVNTTPNTAVLPQAITVGTSAVALPTSALGNRRSIAGRNEGVVTIYLGHAGVSTANGYPVDPGQRFSVDLGPGVTLYAISGTAGQPVRILEAA